MKKHIYLLIVGLLAKCAFAQSKPAEHEWTATVKVTDEDGNPVANAHVGVGYFSNGASSIDGVTDTDGLFVTSHRNVPGVLAYLVSFRIEKNGYYSTWKQIDLGPGYNPTKWNQTVTLALTKIGKPWPCPDFVDKRCVIV